MVSEYCQKCLDVLPKCMCVQKALRSSPEKIWNNGKRQDDGCLVWQGAIIKTSGYGQVRVRGKQWLVHRLAYTLTYGNPGGLLVLHKCDNRACFEPTHLFLGTYEDNTQDMLAKGRGNPRGKRVA